MEHLNTALNVTAIINNLPIGTILPYSGTSVQATDLKATGWLLCAGDAVEQARYPELYRLIGNACGAGATTFNLPDMRGMFLRGLDDTSDHRFDPDGGTRSAQSGGSATGGKPLSRQDDALREHKHGIRNKFVLGSVHRLRQDGDGLYVPFVKEQDGETRDTDGKETRPKNVAVNYIIFAGLPK